MVVLSSLGPMHSTGANPRLKEKWLERVPTELRQSFVDALTAEMKNESQSDWGAIYDQIPNWDRKNKTKADYRKNKDKAWTLIDFVPEYAKDASFEAAPRSWYVSGCARTKSKNNLEDYESNLFATFENGTWHFTALQISFSAVDGPPYRCNFHMGSGLLAGEQMLP